MSDEQDPLKQINEEWVETLAAHTERLVAYSLTHRSMLSHKYMPVTEEQLALLQKPVLDPHTQEERPGILRQAINSLIMEFIHQSMNEEPPLNLVGAWRWKQDVPEAKAGIRLTKTLIDKLARIGFGEDQIIMTCRNLIPIAAREFNAEYQKIAGERGYASMPYDKVAFAEYTKQAVADQQNKRR